MEKILFLIVGIAILTWMPSSVQAQKNKVKKYANSITEEDIFTHLNILASDSLEGRETGKEGQKMAAEYIVSQFKQDGLKAPQGGSYLQKYQLEKLAWKDVYIKVNGVKRENMKDIVYYGTADISEEKELETVFIGDVENVKDKDIDLKGKAVVMVGSGRKDKMQWAKEQGVACVLYTYDTKISTWEERLIRWEHFLKSSRMSLPTKTDEGYAFYVVSPVVIKDLFGFTDEQLLQAVEGKNIEDIPSAILKIKAEKDQQLITAENVLGFIEGSEKKDEIIVITAHYDHIGKDGDVVYNGADDDASGTSAVLELAQAFAQAKADGIKFRRSILFMTVSGEEKGLLGSKYYVEHPVFPLKNTVTNLNIDMIGRTDDKYKDNIDYVYVIGSDKLSEELHKVSEGVNKRYTKLILDYTYNDDNDPNRFYYRSDHYNFAKNGIPVIFYFNGTHEDYHQATDTIEKINLKALKNRAKLVFYTAWELAMRKNRVKVN